MCFFVSSSILAEVQWKQTDWVRVKQKKKPEKMAFQPRDSSARVEGCRLQVNFADLIKGGQKVPVRMSYVE